MKEEAIKDINQPDRPGVNRKTKLNALKIYEDKEKNIKDIIADRESIVQKSLETEIERLHSETQWNSILEEERLAMEEEKHQLIIKEKKIQYKCMQLESRQKDYVSIFIKTI